MDESLCTNHFIFILLKSLLIVDKCSPSYLLSIFNTCVLNTAWVGDLPNARYCVKHLK